MQAPFLLQRALDSTARKGGHKNQNNIGAEIAKQRKSRMNWNLHYRDKVGTSTVVARSAIWRGGVRRRLGVLLFCRRGSGAGGGRPWRCCRSWSRGRRVRRFFRRDIWRRRRGETRRDTWLRRNGNARCRS